jgi:CheY-like chemotaxis protein
MPRRTLLVVDDDADLRRMFRAALSLAGFEVSEASDGLEALRKLDGDRLPDLIILDIRMPIITGHAVAQEVAAQAHLRHIPVMVVTGSNEPLDYLDVACVLRKPIDPDELVRQVWRCINAGAPPPV